MSDRIPERVDPLLLADKKRRYKGRIPLKSMERLLDIVKNQDDFAAFELNFAKSGKLSTIDGFIGAKIRLECQNCLEQLEISVNSGVKLAIVLSIEEAGLIPDDYEPLLCNERTIEFKDIIEDEILLSIPVIPKHQEDCLIRQEDETKTEFNGEPRKDSPFSVLANLKKTGA